MNETQDNNGLTFEDLGSGRVLYNQQGTTAFPVGLASQIFQRCAEMLICSGNNGPYRLYDPCCGGGYLLASIGFLHGERLQSITGSDISETAVELARKNISLLTEEGLRVRTEQLHRLYEEYGKPSHEAALSSAARLQSAIVKRRGAGAAADIPIDIYAADFTRSGSIRGTFDIVITDVPYGQIVEWQTHEADPVHSALDTLLPHLAELSVVAIVSTKEHKISHERYARTGQLKVGKRKITFLTKLT